MNCYLIYHPSRCKSVIGNMTIYHDNFGGNEDPYLWNDKFLHTYCHITQLKNEERQINFWVSGDTYPNFTELFCDCVFLIEEKLYWKNANKINKKDIIVDNAETFKHHYKWYKQHILNKKRRYTLKANSEKSFQPQDEKHMLIDIVPFLNCNGITTKNLIDSIAKSAKGIQLRNSRPFKLDNCLGHKLYDYLYKTAYIKIFGNQLIGKHP